MPALFVDQSENFVSKYQLFDIDGKYLMQLFVELEKHSFFKSLINITMVSDKDKIYHFSLNEDWIPNIDDVVSINKILKELRASINPKGKFSRDFMPQRIILEHILYAMLSKISNKGTILPIADGYPILEINLKESSITGFTKKLRGDLVACRNDFSSNEMLGMLKDLFISLDPLYNNGFIHRDIKPQNIYFDGNQFFLGDMGISIFNDLTLTDAASKFMLGTFKYSSPDLHRTLKYSKTTDMYSLVVTIWQLLEKSEEPPNVWNYSKREFVKANNFEADVPNRFAEKLFRDNNDLYCLLKNFLLRPDKYLPNEFRVLFNLIEFVIDPAIDDKDNHVFVTAFIDRKSFKAKLEKFKTHEKYSQLESVKNLNPEDFNFLTMNTES